MNLQPRPAYAGQVPADGADAKRLVRARLAAKRRRARRIRQAVLAFSVAVFVAMFATIYVQLASGHDPALSASSKKAAASSTSTGSSAAAQKTTTTASGSSEGSSSNGSSGNSAGTGSSKASSTESSPTPSTVTTSQS